MTCECRGFPTGSQVISQRCLGLVERETRVATRLVPALPTSYWSLNRNLLTFRANNTKSRTPESYEVDIIYRLQQLFYLSWNPWKPIFFPFFFNCSDWFWAVNHPRFVGGILTDTTHPLQYCVTIMIIIMIISMILINFIINIIFDSFFGVRLLYLHFCWYYPPKIQTSKSLTNIVWQITFLHLFWGLLLLPPFLNHAHFSPTALAEKRDFRCSFQCSRLILGASGAYFSICSNPWLIIGDCTTQGLITICVFFVNCEGLGLFYLSE